MHATSHNNFGSQLESLSLVGSVYNLSILEKTLQTGEKYVQKDPQNSEKIRRKCSGEELKKVALDLETLRRPRSEDNDLRATGRDVALLTEAFTNLATCQRHGLQSLSLQVVVYRDDASTKILPKDAERHCRPSIFETASTTSILAISCLRTSQLPLHNLDIFAKKPESLACNVPSDALSLVEFGRAVSLRTIKVLSIGISDPLVNTSEDGTESAVSYDESNYSGLSKLIDACQSLGELEVSGYRLSHSTIHSGMRYRCMSHLAQIRPLRRLRKLRLAGLAVDDADLTALLAKHDSSLREVELGHIGIAKGSWKPVMSLLPKPSLDVIYLEELRESRKLMQFDGEQEREFTNISGHYAGSEIIRCWGPDARKGFIYHFYEGRAIGAPRVWGRTPRTREEFGGN